MQTINRTRAGDAAPPLPNYPVEFDNVARVKATRDGRILLRLIRPVPDDAHLAEANLTPADARSLAVYLVDCANALDNPAARVIVDAEASGCWRCIQPATCKENGFCSIERRDLDELVGQGIGHE